MHDPANPADNPGATFESTHDTLEQVIAWFSAQIITEQRQPAPDTQRLEQLLAERKTAVADRRRLAEADQRELNRLQATYDARLRELNGG